MSVGRGYFFIKKKSKKTTISSGVIIAGRGVSKVLKIFCSGTLRGLIEKRIAYSPFCLSREIF
jgi:hypothetical protein